MNRLGSIPVGCFWEPLWEDIKEGLIRFVWGSAAVIFEYSETGRDYPVNSEMFSLSSSNK